MKSISIFAFTLLLVTMTAKAQQSKLSAAKPTATINQCDELKKENDFLKKSLTLNEPILLVTSEDLEFKIVKITGDKKTQIVTIEVLATNKIQNRKIGFQLNSIKIVTLSGEIFTPTQYSIPKNENIYSSDYSELTLSTDVSIKSTYSFGTFLPTTEYIKLFNLGIKIFNAQDYHKDLNLVYEFKDLKIAWK